MHAAERVRPLPALRLRRALGQARLELLPRALALGLPLQSAPRVPQGAWGFRQLRSPASRWRVLRDWVRVWRRLKACSPVETQVSDIGSTGTV